MALQWVIRARPLPALFFTEPAGFFSFVSVDNKWGVEPRTQVREGERKISAIWVPDLAEQFPFFWENSTHPLKWYFKISEKEMDYSVTLTIGRNNTILITYL